jgi:hypothetical protein
MCSAISSRPRLDDLKKEARQLLHAPLHRRDAAAVRRYHSIDKLAGLAQPRLDDAQCVVAREHVYDSGAGLSGKNVYRRWGVMDGRAMVAEAIAEAGAQM